MTGRGYGTSVRFRSLIALALLGLLCNSCVYARIFYFNFPALSATSYFDNRPVKASSAPVRIPVAKAEAAFELTDGERAKYRTFDVLLEANDTHAFLAIKDDALVYERYFHGTVATTQLPSFSISKSFAALLIGCAVDDGLIRSIDESLVTYLPQLAEKPYYREIRLDHLLRMISGIDFYEESTAGASLYYTTDMHARIFEYEVKWPPGEHYLYGSINIQLLWAVLHRRLKGKTVAEYFQERVWDPLGAVDPAAWALDSESSGIEKFFGGFSATARDHARLGLLFLHGGTLNGRRVVSEDWIARSLSPDPVAGVVHTSDGTVKHAKYQWFLTPDERCFFAKGYHGQYIFVVPDRHVVFVRFAEGYGDIDWPALFVRLADRM